MVEDKGRRKLATRYAATKQRMINQALKLHFGGVMPARRMDDEEDEEGGDGEAPESSSDRTAATTVGESSGIGWRGLELDVDDGAKGVLTGVGLDCGTCSVAAWIGGGTG